jgi:hypothetical protein
MEAEPAVAIFIKSTTPVVKDNVTIDASPPLNPVLLSIPPSNGKKSAEAEDVPKSPASSSSSTSVGSHASSACSSPRKKMASWLSFMTSSSSSPSLSSSSKQNNRHNARQKGGYVNEGAQTKMVVAVKPILKAAKPVDHAALQVADLPVIQKSAAMSPMEVRRLTLERANRLHFLELQQQSQAMSIDSFSDPDMSVTSLTSWGSPPESFSKSPLEPSLPKDLERDDFVQVKTAKTLRFLEYVLVGEAWGRWDYDRTGIDYEAKRMNPALVLAIRAELNDLKAQMTVHPDSAHHTQFYYVPEGYLRPSSTTSNTMDQV